MTPEQEEQVRRALAAAARADRPEGEDATPPLPPQVADRLDHVLAELVAGRAARGGTEPGQVGSDDLTARRARKWPNVLVAAAAVAVIAVAGGAVATRGFGGGGGSSAGSSADSQAGGASQDKVSPEAVAPGSSGEGDVREPRLRSSSLAADVQRVVDTAPAGSLRRGETLTGGGARPDGAPCDPPPVGRGAVVVAVLLDGRPATLVLAAPTGGTREALVYSCADGATPVATTTLRQR